MNQTPEAPVAPHVSDTAITTSAPQSFLARFLGRSTSSTTLPTPSTPSKSEHPNASKSDSEVQPRPAENITSAIATLRLSEDNKAQQVSQSGLETESTVTPTQFGREHGDITPKMRQKTDQPIRNVEKTPEQVADEQEDTLIRVKPEAESLLFEGRPSHPILRFSASNALLAHDALEQAGLPLGFMWSPFGELRETTRVPRAPHRCGTCGSFVAKGNGAEGLLKGSSQWTCQFCGRNDNDAGNSTSKSISDPKSYPEFYVDTVEYEHPQPVNAARSRRGAIVLIVDENLESKEAEWARTATAAVHIAAAESGLRFALLTAGSGCSAAVRNDDDATIPTLEMLSVARASSLTAKEKERFFLNPPSSVVNGTAHMKGTYAELQKAPTDVFITPRAPSAFAGDLETPVGNELNDETQMKKRLVRLPSDAESRRLDVALFVAFELINDMADCERSRILSLVTGPPTLAEHAMPSTFPSATADENSEQRSADETETIVALTKLYEQVGSKAGDMRIALDFLCFAAPEGFAGDILLGASKRSRGGLVYSAAHSFSAASALAEAAVFLVQRSTSPGVVSIRVSSPLSVARVIGPAFPTASPQTYAVPGIDPITGFCVMLKPNLSSEAEANPPSAVLQLAAKSSKVTRVVTVRIPLTTNGSEYFNSLDAEICALILGKACIVSNGALTKPSIACRSLDVTVQRLLLGSEKAVGVVRLMYELRRGLLLGEHVHPNISLILRSFFLRSECSLASLLMSPRLFTNVTADDATGLMAEVQLEKKVLKDDAVHVLDTGFNVFVYVGSRASKDAEAAISESARAVAARRVTPCQLWKLKPGKDAEFLLDMYLSPANPAKGRRRLEPVEQGFVPYCTSLARGSKTVKALKRIQYEQNRASS